LPDSFRFLAHKTFRKNFEDFLKKHPTFTKSLFTNLEKARSNPFSGKPMHSLPKKLRQKVFRLWIGDANDFRFIYYVARQTLSVVGIYLTLEPRSKFSYDKSDWLGRLETIVVDLENENYNEFEILNTEEAVKKI